MAESGKAVSYQQTQDTITRHKRPPPDPDPPRSIPDTPVVRDQEADHKLALQLIDIGYRAMAQKLQSNKAAMKQLLRVTEEMRRHWNAQWF
jgi:hypothetical protein